LGNASDRKIWISGDDVRKQQIHQKLKKLSVFLKQFLELLTGFGTIVSVCGSVVLSTNAKNRPYPTVEREASAMV